MPPKKGKKKKPVYPLSFHPAVNMTQLLLNYGYEKVQQGQLSQDEWLWSWQQRCSFHSSLMGKRQWEEALRLWPGDALWWRGAAQRKEGRLVPWSFLWKNSCGLKKHLARASLKLSMTAVALSCACRKQSTNIPWSSVDVLPDVLDNNRWFLQFSSLQSLSPVWLFATPWITAHQVSLSITNSWSSHKFMSIESVMPSSHLILCRPLLLLPPVPPSIRVFSNESTLYVRWPKYCSFSFSISRSKEHPGLISFRMDWLDLLAVQGTLKSLLQHHSSKASVLWRSAFFTVQLSHPYMTTGKTIALSRWTFVRQSNVFAFQYTI